MSQKEWEDIGRTAGWLGEQKEMMKEKYGDREAKRK